MVILGIKKIIIVGTFILGFMIITNVFALNNNADMVNVATESIIATESELRDAKEIIDEIKKELSVNHYDRITTEIAQEVFHPKEIDSFGEGKGCTPIARIVVQETDIKRLGKLSLSFDCAYESENLVPILNILDEYKIKATFFGTLDFIKAHPELVIEIVKRGHDFGSHSSKHPHYNEMSDEDVVRDVLTCHNYVFDTFGLDMCLFRFPFGESNERNMELVTKLGYFPISWSFDSMDWKNEGIEKIFKRVTTHPFVNGQIMLFHIAGKYTVEALPATIQYLKQKGFDFIRVSDLIYKEDFRSFWGTQSKKS